MLLNMWIQNHILSVDETDNNYKIVIANDNEFEREVPRMISVTSVGPSLVKA